MGLTSSSSLTSPAAQVFPTPFPFASPGGASSPLVVGGSGAVGLRLCRAVGDTPLDDDDGRSRVEGDIREGIPSTIVGEEEVLASWVAGVCACR